MRRNRWSKRILPFTAMLVFCAATVSGQLPLDVEAERSERLRERIEIMRVWKLTDLLNLDEDRAAKFFPRYQRYLARSDSIEQLVRALDDSIEAGLRSGRADFGKLLDRSRELEKRRYELRRELIDKSGDLLNEQEQVALTLFERRFEQRLREMVHELQQQMGPPGPRRYGWPDCGPSGP